MVRNVLKNPGRALEIAANLGSAFASRSPKAASSSLPEMINFYLTYLKRKSSIVPKFNFLFTKIYTREASMNCHSGFATPIRCDS